MSSCIAVEPAVATYRRVVPGKVFLPTNGRIDRPSPIIRIDDDCEANTRALVTTEKNTMATRSVFMSSLTVQVHLRGSRQHPGTF